MSTAGSIFRRRRDRHPGVKISYPKGLPESLLNALVPEVMEYIELLEEQVVTLKNRVAELEAPSSPIERVPRYPGGDGT